MSEVTRYLASYLYETTSGEAMILKDTPGIYVREVVMASEYDTLKQQLATLTTVHQQVEEERDIAERALTAKGYRKQCDIMACNCGPQWHHGGHAEQRLSEIAEAAFAPPTEAG